MDLWKSFSSAFFAQVIRVGPKSQTPRATVVELTNETEIMRSAWFNSYHRPWYPRTIRLRKQLIGEEGR